MENDFFAGTDRCFTGAFKTGWMRKIKDIQKSWLWKKIPFKDEPGYQHYFALSAGINVYTPGNIRRSDLIEDDRPYAGFLHGGLSFLSISRTHRENLELVVGIVGPHSYAQELQKFVHSVEFINGFHPKGWNHQLKDEITVSLVYENQWKLRKSSGRGFGFEVIPHLGGGLGTAYTYLSSGLQVRGGWNLPDDFGVPLLRPGGDRSLGFRCPGNAGIHLFAAVDGKAVLRTIFLDGNTFQESHRVDKNIFTADFHLGTRLRMGGFNFSYEYILWTKRFKTEDRKHLFGVLSLSYSF
ncbi:lipid A deacylase LpxR family protein [bacterium]|nr:lipid A deacylase LpxR family protein [bacterium]